MINRATIAGFAGKDARTSSTHNGRSMTRLSIATTRRYKDADGSWQEKTQWHAVISYGIAADYAAKIQTGDHVFLEGELIYREYERTIETENGPVKVMWPVTEVVIDSISILDRREKQGKKGAALAASTNPADLHSIFESVKFRAAGCTLLSTRILDVILNRAEKIVRISLIGGSSRIHVGGSSLRVSTAVPHTVYSVFEAISALGFAYQKPDPGR